MSRSRQRRAERRKRRIEYRLRDRDWSAQEEPMFRATNVHYDVADRTRAMGYGGIGAIHLMCRQTGLLYTHSNVAAAQESLWMECRTV